MRKHFLILMLLTLLPMASWAEAITGYTAVFDDMVYTGVEQDLPAPTKLQKGGDQILDGIHATDWKKGGVSVTKILDAGEYTCTVQADGYDGTITATLTVAKSVVTVTGVNIPVTAGITFGDPKSEVEALYDAEYAFAASLELDDAAKEALEAQFDAQLTFATDYDQWVDIAAFYVRPVIDALESTFTNYTFEPVDGALTVSPKTFTADLISSIADITYTAANLEDGVPARITLKDGTYVIDGDDFNYAYSKGGAATEHVKNAGTYTVTLTAKANTNYTGSASKEFVVKKAGLLFTSLDVDDKVYNAEGITATVATKVEVQGWLDTGAPVVTDIVLKAQRSTDANPLALADATDVGEYTLVVSGTKAADLMYDNYYPFYQSTGKTTISQRTLRISVIPQSRMATGTDNFEAGIADAKDYVTVGAGVAGEGLVGEDAIKTYPTVKREAGSSIGTYELFIVENTTVIKKGATTAVKTGNYNIVATPSTYTIVGGIIAIIPTAKTITYGDPTPKAKDMSATISGLPTADLTEELQDAVNKCVKFDGAAPVNAGTYPEAIVLDNDALNEVLPASITDNYSVITYKNRYIIKKRALTKIEVADQTLYVKDGDDHDELDQKQVIFTADGYTLTDEDLETLENEYDLAFGAEVVGDYDADPVTYDEGIIFKFQGATTAFSNFELPEGVANFDEAVEDKLIFGDLTFCARDQHLALDANYYDVDNTMTDAIIALDGQKVEDVTFANRVLKKQVWETLVLPFNTTVFEVSRKLNYAIIDLLDETANDANIHFNIAMNEIPANTPFLVKVQKKVNLADVTFEHKTIVAPTQLDDNDNPYIEDMAGHKLVGLYDTMKDLTGAGIWALNQDGIFVQLTTKKTDLQATKAYLDLTADADAREILIQEADGSTTAISNITTEVATNASTGWYTINGVKLNSMPTEKGIYILNGKKIVVK